jgi:hypothetical protein
VEREIVDFDHGSQYEIGHLPEHRSKLCGSGETTASGANREIASSAKGLNWGARTATRSNGLRSAAPTFFAD